MNINPKVSIIIPCFNNENYIDQAIKSALAQNYPNIEILVIDDGSTDNSWQRIQTYNDRKVIALKQSNQGACVARNLGLKHATGEYIKFLDADDILAENIIETQVKQLEKAPKKTIVFGYCYNFVGNTKNIEPYPKSINAVDQKFLTTLVLKNILTSCALYPKSALVTVGGFNPNVSSRQEWALNLQLFLNDFKFHYVDDLTYYRRLHDSEFRISNRKHQSDIELNNLNTIYDSLPENNDPEYKAAWAYVYWRTGRYILINEGRKKAELFFSKAKTISPGNHKKYWPKSYRLVVTIFGLYLPEKIQSTLMSIYRHFQYKANPPSDNN